MQDHDWERVRSIFDKRCVSRPVAEARPYVPYLGGDAGRWVHTVERFPDEYILLELGDRVAGKHRRAPSRKVMHALGATERHRWTSGKWDREQDQGPFAAIPPEQRRATIAKDVNALDDDGNPINGLVMFKHPVDSIPYPPQLRPDKDPDVTSHDHADYKPKVRRRHESGKKHDRRGIRIEGEHQHRHGKYKVAVSPRTTVRYFQPHPLRLPRGGCSHKPPCTTAEEHTLKHIAKHHEADDGYGLSAPTHSHEARVPDDEADTYGQRIDMHPVTRRRLDDGEVPDRWFFCLEGNLKNDSLVTAGEFTANVPSVNMWPAPELEAFARERLRDVPVFVVPDSDWVDNEKVATQAFLCVDALERFGVEAYVAAPTPEPAHCAIHDEPADAKRGVDDYAADGCDPLNMPVVIRKLPPAFDSWAAIVRSDRRLGEIRARERLIEVTGWAARHADEHGRVVRPGKKMAHYTGTSLKQIDAVINALAMLEDLHERLGLPEPPFTVGIEELDAWERARTLDGRAWKITVIEVRRELRAVPIEGLTVRRILNQRSSRGPKDTSERLALSASPT